MEKKSLPKEKTIAEIIQILLKNKKILISIVLFFLTITIIFTLLSKPVYEASALLKKERAPENNMSNDITTLFNLQSLDEIETEIQLVKTFDVLSGVVKEMFLNFNLTDVVINSKTLNLNCNPVELSDPKNFSKYRKDYNLPHIRRFDFDLSNKNIAGDYVLIKTAENEFTLKSKLTGRVLATTNSYIKNLEREGQNTFNVDSINTDSNVYSNPDVFRISNDDFTLEIEWIDVPIGSSIDFSVSDLNETIIDFQKKINVKREGKTDVFTVSYSSNSPVAAALITNKIVDKFRESRILQKKQTIRYSFDFVDKQLEEAQEKLKESENDLTRFKAGGQIMTIDASSQELINFLSSLEAEKLNTDLQLADYKNKVDDFEKELRKSGYFDQSFLTPEGQVETNSPFSQLVRQLSDLELQKLELLQKRTENHPDVIAIDQQISLTREKLAGFNENTITAYKIIINTLEKKLLKLNDLMSKYEVKLQMLPGQENRLAQLMRQKNVHEKIFTILLDQREAMRIAELSKLQDITLIDEARIPVNPISPRKILNVIIGLVLGSFFAVLAVFLLELWKNRFITIDELEQVFNLPILSLIPKYSKQLSKKMKSLEPSKKFVTLAEESEGIVETYRLLKTKLSNQLEESSKVIMVTSCEENSGKTTVVGNLAITFARDAKRVLVIDCDLRKGELSKQFGFGSKDQGLIQFLSSDSPLKIYNKVIKTVDVISSGGVNDDSGSLLNSYRMKLFFSHLDYNQYDIILIDTPPVTRVVDPLILGDFIKEAVVVIRPQLSLRETVMWGIQELVDAKISIKGIVANGAEIQNSYYYRYKYGYGYGYGKQKETKSRKRFKEVIS